MYFWGRRFLLRTDHQVLVSLLSSRGTGRRPQHTARWSAKLRYYNLNVAYQRGCNNAMAGAPSRLPMTSTAESDTNEKVVSVMLSCITKEQVQWGTAKLMPRVCGQVY